MFKVAEMAAQGTRIIDATRISDGAYVTLKIVRSSDNGKEVGIANFLSSPELAADPHNHCVPIYETFKMPDDDDITVLVMPLLRDWRSPVLKTVGEAMDMFGQLFEVK
jgi:hypothetical protein